MGRPDESPDVKASKALAYILRHGAEKEGLDMRADGYLRLVDVLARPRLKGVTEADVVRLVRENAKQRFELAWAYDPSPPRPRKKRVNQPRKKKAGDGGGGGGGGRGGPSTAVPAGGAPAEPDAARIDDVRAELAAASLSDAPADGPPPAPAPAPAPVDLPLVVVPRLDNDDDAAAAAAAAGQASSAPAAEWFIRATQGHSLALDPAAHLLPVTDDADGRRRAGLAVHGTRWELWHVLKEQGLSRMSRQHVHLAPSFVGAITWPLTTAPRPHSTLHIYLSPSLLAAQTPPIPLYTSRNGVVLTPGDAAGRVPAACWARAVRVRGGQRTVVWENGAKVERALTEEEENEEREVSERCRVDGAREVEPAHADREAPDAAAAAAPGA